MPKQQAPACMASCRTRALLCTAAIWCALVRVPQHGHLVHLQQNAFEYGKEEQFAARYTFLASPADRQLLLSFGLKLVLYQPPTTKGPSSALQAAQQAQQAMEVDGGAAAAAPEAPPPPAGMSRADVAAVEGMQPPAGVVVGRAVVSFWWWGQACIFGVYLCACVCVIWWSAAGIGIWRKLRACSIVSRG